MESSSNSGDPFLAAPPHLFYAPAASSGLLYHDFSVSSVLSRPLLTSASSALSSGPTIRVKQEPTTMVYSMLRILEHLIKFLGPTEALYTLACLHSTLRAEVYSRNYLKLIFPASRSFYKTLACTQHQSEEHKDVIAHRKMLRKPYGRSILWQILIRGDTSPLPMQEYLSTWTGNGERTPDDEDVILKDLGRTFAKEEKFQHGRLNGSLYRLLCTIASKHQKMGYCQGFNLVAATMLTHLVYPCVIQPQAYLQCLSFRSPERALEELIDTSRRIEIKMNEEVAKLADEQGQNTRGSEAGSEHRKASERTKPYFATPSDLLLRQEALVCQCLCSMVNLLDLDKELYDKNLMQMRVKHDVFKQFVKNFLPEVLAKIEDVGLPDLQFFVCNWFMTLYTDPCSRFDRSLDLDPKGRHDKLITAIWEQFILRGWKIIFRIALLILDELSVMIASTEELDGILALLSDPFTSIRNHGRSNRSCLTGSWILRQAHGRFKVTTTQIQAMEYQLQNEGKPDQAISRPKTPSLSDPPVNNHMEVPDASSYHRQRKRTVLSRDRLSLRRRTRDEQPSHFRGFINKFSDHAN